MKQIQFSRELSSGIQTLLLHKLRSFLTMLGVVFGVGSVVAMLAVGEGASKEALEQIRKLGSHNILISSVKPAEEDAAGTTPSFMSIYGLTYMDHERIAQSFSSVKKNVPVKLVRKEARIGHRAVELRVVGTSDQWFEVIPRPVLGGRTLMQKDLDAKSPVVILTEFGARKLLATRQTIGQTIRIGVDSFTVIGIVKNETGASGAMQIPDREIDAYIPITTAMSYFGDVVIKMSSGSRLREKVELNQIIVQVASLDQVEPSARAIERMLSLFHKKKDFQIQVPLALLKQAEATKRTFNIVLGAIAGISLLVGGIGIMNIMLASVTERTREIGIRRAIGAKRKQIIIQFLIEAMVLSFVGGILGLAMGVAIPFFITWFAKMPTVITPMGILLPLCVSLGIGIVFGLYPAARAARVDPIVALRHE
ncbi:ABC transporter permease [Desulfotignum balticum]|jgi:putative ABC transport system permease protein|uniref:ABC transporter permease n=1 Tax=Desulfotignum balticum TaxID=115781 RepID=UPI0004298B3E|nr:ABC transporter permease [Desulfotignum balticum]